MIKLLIWIRFTDLNEAQCQSISRGHAGVCSVIFSQAYEDTVEIQKIFITARDNICRNGEGAGFSSPAISYTPRHLTKAVEELTAQKLAGQSAEAAEDSSKCKVNSSCVMIALIPLLGLC